MTDALGVALGIFGLRVLGNAVTTVRLVMLAREKTNLVLILSFIESMIFAVALGAVVQNLNSIPNLVAYSGGFAVGSSVGIWLERRLTLGYVRVSIITRNSGKDVAKAIREAGFGATLLDAHGAESDVYVVETVLERRNVSPCVSAIQKADPHAFITMHALQSTYKGYVPSVQPGLARILSRN